jgi:hypothetical protein
MTIVGLGVVTLLQIFSLGLRLGTRSSERTDVVNHGAHVMDELLARKKLSEGSESGRLGADARWQAQTQAVRESTSTLRLESQWELKEVTVEMSVGDGGRERSIEFKTLRLARKSNSP